jgi:hypothetical protein
MLAVAARCSVQAQLWRPWAPNSPPVAPRAWDALRRQTAPLHHRREYEQILVSLDKAFVSGIKLARDHLRLAIFQLQPRQELDQRRTGVAHAIGLLDPLAYRGAGPWQRLPPVFQPVPPCCRQFAGAALVIKSASQIRPFSPYTGTNSGSYHRPGREPSNRLAAHRRAAATTARRVSYVSAFPSRTSAIGPPGCWDESHRESCPRQDRLRDNGSHFSPIADRGIVSNERQHNFLLDRRPVAGRHDSAMASSAP